MGTAATMNVRIGTDIAPLKQGLKDAQAEVERSAQLMGTSLAKSGPSAATGATVGREFVAGLSSEFSKANTQLRAALFQGSLTQAQFRTEGTKAASEFNAGITAALAQLSARGLLTPEVQAQMVRAYKAAGLQAGAAFQAGAAAAAPAAGGGALSFMSRLNERPISNMVTGLALVAGSADSSTSAVTKMTRSVEIAAFTLGGPAWGAAATAVGTGLDMITRKFEAAKKEAKAAGEAFVAAVRGMVNSGDVTGLINKQQAILMGQPYDGAGRGGGYKGGLLDMRAGIAETESQLAAARLAAAREARNRGVPLSGLLVAGMPTPSANEGREVVNALAARLADQKQAAAVLERQVADLERRIRNPPEIRPVATPAPAITITGRSTSSAALGTGTGSSAESALRLPTIADLEQRLSNASDLVGRRLNLSIEDATANARLLSDAFALADDKASVLPQILPMAESAAARALAVIQQYPDPLNEANIAAQRVLRTLEGIRELGPLQTLFDARGMGSAPDFLTKLGGGDARKGFLSLGDANAMTSQKSEVPPKIDMFRQAVQAGLTRLESTLQQVGAGIAQTLGARVAGGSTAGGIGALLGGAAGGAAAEGAGKLVGSAIGGTLGAAAGSVVPVVGTIIGTVVGSFIGKGIGALFGGGKKAADNSAASLNKLAAAAQRTAEALLNAPSGFKVALERFRASDPLPVPGGAGLPAGYGPASGGGIFTGDIIVYGVQDVASFETELARRARQSGRRGGTTRWQLAAAGA